MTFGITCNWAPACSYYWEGLMLSLPNLLIPMEMVSPMKMTFARRKPASRHYTVARMQMETAYRMAKTPARRKPAWLP